MAVVDNKIDWNRVFVYSDTIVQFYIKSKIYNYGLISTEDPIDFQVEFSSIITNILRNYMKSVDKHQSGVISKILIKEDYESSLNGYIEVLSFRKLENIFRKKKNLDHYINKAKSNVRNKKLEILL